MSSRFRTRPLGSLAVLLATSAAATILSGRIQAASINWSNTGGDFMWTNTANWTGSVLPGVADTAVMAVATAQNVFLNNSTQNIQGLLFNQAVTYTMYGGANTTVTPGVINGTLVLGFVDQTGNAGNVLSPNVAVTTTNSGADVLTSNVTQQTLQLQGMVTAGGVTKTGAGTLRLGTSGTAYNGAILGDIVINGGTFQASAANASGVNNPIASSGAIGAVGTINAGDEIIIGASGVTLSTTHSNLASAGAAVTYDWGRNVVANNNSFTWNADRAAGSATSGVAQVGTITLGTATMTTTTGNGFSHRTDGLILNSGATSTISNAALLVVDSLIGDATTKLVKAGASELRIASGATGNATTFAGDIDLAAGTLTLQSDAVGVQPLGNASTQINITAATPTLSLRADTATTFDGTPVFAGNNSFNYDVRPVSGTTSLTMTAGPLTVGNATVTINGDRHNLILPSLTQAAGSTTILGVNSAVNGSQSLRLNGLTATANSVLRKTGGQALFLSAVDNPNFFGKLEVNGGTLQIEGASGAVPVANSAGVQFISSSTLNLRAAANTDFVTNISFGPNTISSTISSDRLTGALTGQTLTVGTIDVSASPSLGARTLTTSSGNSFILAADAILLSAGNATLNFGGDVTTPVVNTTGGTGLIKLGSAGLTVTADNSTTWNTPTALRAGTLTGTVANSLGTGLITVGSTANTAGFIVSASRLNYNAAGASGNSTGVDAIATAGGAIDFGTTPNSGDVFQVDAGGRIQGTTAQLAALNAGTGGNLTLAPDAIIVHENIAVTGGSAATVSGLDSAAAYYGKLYYGTVVTTTGALPDLGAGTPWKGVALDSTGGRNVLGTGTSLLTMNVLGGDSDAATTEVSFLSMFDQTLSFGTTSTTDGTFAFGPASPANKYTIEIVGNQGTSTLGNVPGGRVQIGEVAATSNIAANVDKIYVRGGTLIIPATGTQGGVPIEVNGNASLDIGNVAGNILDGNVTFKNGGVFFFNDAQNLTGTGTLTFESGSKLDITGSAPATFFDTVLNTQTINLTGNNYTVRFAANNLTGMDAKIPDAGVTYAVSGGATAAAFSADFTTSLTTNTQTGGITIDNGVLTNDGTSRGLVGAVNTPANTPLTVAATRNTTLAVASNITLGAANLTVGSDSVIDNRDKNANYTAVTSTNVPDYFNSLPVVSFTGAVTANDVTMKHTSLYFINGGTQLTGKLTNNGGVLYLDGGGSTGTNAGELTSKLAAGTLAPGGIFLNEYGRIEMSLVTTTSNGSRLAITQPFVLNSDVNPNDNRSFYVNKSAGTDTGIDFTNVTLNPGATLAVQESNTDVRMSLSINGNAIASTSNINTNIDYNSLTRGPNADANVGVGNSVVLQQGRLNVTNWQTSQNTVSNVFGTIGSGVQVDMIRGDLYFQPGSVLNGVVRAQTAPAGGTSFLRVTSNGSASDSTLTGTGRIELGRSPAAAGPEDLEVMGSEVASGTSPLVTVGVPVRIVDDGVSTNIDGIIRSQRFSDLAIAARTAVNDLQLNAGAGVQLVTQNSIPLTVNTTTLAGNGTIDVNNTGITLTTVNAGVNALTLQGAAVPTITNAVTAGQLNVNGLTMTVDLANVSGGLSVGQSTTGTVGTAGNVTVTGNVAGALTVNSSTANLTSNVGNGLNVTAGVVNFTGTNTKTVAGPVSLDGANVVATGTVDFGTTVITSAANHVVGGLVESRIIGAVGLTATPTAAQLGNGGVRTEIRGANIASPSPELYVYSGQFYDADGLFTFAENIDDNVQITIDGTIVLRNNTGTTPWTTITSTSSKDGLIGGTGVTEAGVNSGTPKTDHNFGMGTNADGWHAIEVRLYNGSGGGGPGTGQGWTSAFGVGLNTSGTSSLLGGSFIKPVDPGDATLFRTTQATAFNVAANSTVKAGGMSNVGAVNLNGATSTLQLVANGGATESSVGAIVVAGSASGSVSVAEAGDTLTVGNLNLTGSLALSGAGDFVVTGVGSGAGALTKSGAGTLTVNGSVNGLTTVNDGIVKGGGTFNGGLALTAATIAPGNSPGTLTTATLAATNATTFQFELGSNIAGFTYDQIVVTGNNIDLGGAALSLQSLGGFANNDILTLILNNGTDADVGVFAGIANGATLNLAGGVQLQISYFDDASTAGLELAGGNDVSVLVSVPEPASAMVLLAGLGVLAGLGRVRRRES